jgi:hypothetical protein
LGSKEKPEIIVLIYLCYENWEIILLRQNYESLVRQIKGKTKLNQ